MDPSTDDELGDRLDHLLRPRLPWRTTDLTECGRDPDRYPAISHDDYRARLIRYGQRRTAFTVCQTCAGQVTNDTLRGSPLDDNRIVNVLARELRRQRWEPDSTLERELQAIVALVEHHRDEYDATLNGLGDVTNLNAKRTANRRRRIKR